MTDLAQKRLAGLPEHVCRAVEVLSSEEAVSAIWLIGSRASGTDSETSDWDLLVFSAGEPRTRIRMARDIDVIRVGPSLHFLADGQKHEDFLQDFKPWCWQESGDSASYLGLEFDEVPEGPQVAVDHGSSVRRPSRRGILLWART